METEELKLESIDGIECKYVLYRKVNGKLKYLFGVYTLEEGLYYLKNPEEAYKQNKIYNIGCYCMLAFLIISFALILL